MHRPLGLTWAGFRVLVTLAVSGALEPTRLAPRGHGRAAVRRGQYTRTRWADQPHHCAARPSQRGAGADRARAGSVRRGQGGQQRAQGAMVNVLAADERAELVRLLLKLAGQPAEADVRRRNYRRPRPHPDHQSPGCYLEPVPNDVDNDEYFAEHDERWTDEDDSSDAVQPLADTMERFLGDHGPLTLEQLAGRLSESEPGLIAAVGAEDLAELLRRITDEFDGFWQVGTVSPPRTSCWDGPGSPTSSASRRSNAGALLLHCDLDVLGTTRGLVTDEGQHLEIVFGSGPAGRKRPWGAAGARRFGSPASPRATTWRSARTRRRSPWSRST